MNIYLLGDSHFARMIRENDEAHKALKKLGEVINLSRSGQTTRMAQEHLESLKLAREGDMLITIFGDNDCANWKKIPYEEFRKNYQRIIDAFTGRIILVTPAPIHPLKQKGTGRPNREIKKYAKIVKELSEKNNVEVIDLYSQLRREMFRFRDVHESDGVHLNERGYAVLNKTFLRL